MARQEFDWIDDAFDDAKSAEAFNRGKPEKADGDFDWIDDAFDDARTAADMANARGPKVAAVLLVVVIILAFLLVGYAVVGIVGSFETM